MRCKQNRDDLEGRPPKALYVHVPFCQAKCAYCDFCSIPLDRELAAEVTAATAGELAAHEPLLDRPTGSIFVGGGTPTALPLELLSDLLGHLACLADGRTEFTVEANPGTLWEEVLCCLVDAGVNRLSLGVQSFEAAELEVLERIHTPQQARRAVERARQAGTDNISLDLMYALPGQSPETWGASLREAVELGVDHVSCYALSFEEGTPLERRRSTGELAEMDEDLQADLYHQARETLEAAGLRQYEISSFARPGRECRHNLVYWRNEGYLGVGPGAASYVGGVRRVNTASLEEYVERIARDGQAVTESERLTGAKKLAEALFLGLRLREGIDRAAYEGRFGVDPVGFFPKTFEACAKQQLVSVSENHVQLNGEALFISNAIFADLLSEAESVE